MRPWPDQTFLLSREKENDDRTSGPDTEKLAAFGSGLPGPGSHFSHMVRTAKQHQQKKGPHLWQHKRHLQREHLLCVCSAVPYRRTASSQVLAASPSSRELFQSPPS